MPPSPLRRAPHSHALAVVFAGGLLGCGTEADLADAELQQDPIIGGTAVSAATETAEGLISLPGCSGALIDPDTVMTATHCDSFGSVWARGTDGLMKERSISTLIPVGTTDITLFRLGTKPAGWPSVSRTMSRTASANLKDQNVTCYGKGDTAYIPGGGTSGSGSQWRKLVRPIHDYLSATNLLVLKSVNGSETLAPADSGGSCLIGTQPVGVTSSAHGDCTDPAQCGMTFTNIKENYLSGTNRFAAYIDNARTRPAARWRKADLKNGWTHAPYSTNNVGFALDTNIVHLRGAIANGTTNYAFTLEPGFRPSATVFVPVNLSASTKGRLQIDADGRVYVYAESGLFNNAQGFTSLDGVSFSRDSAAYTPIQPKNGWGNTPYGTRSLAVTHNSGIVRLQGAIQTSGTNVIAFTLPAGFRPSTRIYVPVDMYAGAKGRVIVDFNGDVWVDAEGADTAAFQFTSLEGVAFATTAGGFTALPPANGWATYPVGRAPAVANRGGIVSFQGAIKTTGTNMNALFLPEQFRPATSVYATVDLCNAKKGRVLNKPDGWVLVQYQQAIADAQCFTSLEGVQFGI